MSYRFSARLVAFALLHATGPVFAEPLPEIYLLMGQSNMSGRGRFDGQDVASLAADVRIEMLGNDGKFRLAREPLDSAVGQIDIVSRDPQAGFGPGLVFARAMHQRGRAPPLILVPCPKGGTTILAWAQSNNPETLYGNCILRAKFARSRGRLAGVLWYQGESDALDSALAVVWGNAFRKLVLGLRADLEDPCLPVVVTGLADPPNARWPQPFPGWAEVQAQQMTVARTIPRVAFATATGLDRNPDSLHLSTKGQIALGGRLATAVTAAQAASCEASNAH